MITVRSGRNEDLATLRQIELSAAALFSPSDLPPELPQATSVSELARVLADGLLWVAQDERAEPVGFVACKLFGTALHILEMDVTPDRGRRGIGSLLLQHAITCAGQMPRVDVLTLTTFRHVAWNAPFYTKNGFKALEGDGGYAHLARALA